MAPSLQLEKRAFRRQEFLGMQATIGLANGSSVKGEIQDVGPGGIRMAVRMNRAHAIQQALPNSRVTISAVGPFSFNTSAILAWTKTDSEKFMQLGLQTHHARSVLDEIDFRETSRQFDILSSEDERADFIKDMVLLSGELPIHLNIDGRSWTGTFEHRSKLKKIDHLTMVLTKDFAKANLSKSDQILCSLEIFDTFYAFYSKLQSVSQNIIQIEVPDRIVRLYRRALSRLSNPGDFQIEMPTPFSQHGAETFRFFDLHESGGSILIGFDSAPLPVGLRIPHAKLRMNESLLSNVEVTVVGATTMEAGVLTQLRFEEESVGPISKFAKKVIEKRYPKIQDAYANDFDRFWELLEKSGYVGEREGGVIEHSKSEARDTWAHAMETNFGIARNFGIVNGEQFTGGAHLTQYYPNTWLFHQLAILPGKQGADMPLLYCAIADFMAARKAKYVLGFFNADHSWTQKTYMSFLDTYPYSEDNHFERFETYQVNLAETPEPKTSPKTEIRKATKYDLKRVARFFETTKSEMYQDALDLKSPESLRVIDLGQEYKAVELYRHREFFIVEKNQKLVAFAMADIASGGLNVFSLCDSFQIFIVDPGLFGEKDEMHLIQTTAEWYRSFGKQEALYLSQAKREWPSGHEYLQWVVSLNYWIAKSCIFARYKSHIRRLFGRIQTRRRKVRERIRKKEAGTQ